MTSNNLKKQNDNNGNTLIILINQNNEVIENLSYCTAEQLAFEQRVSLLKICDKPLKYKLVDLGKQKYLEKKRKSRFNKLHKRIVIKEVNIRSSIAKADLDVKLKSIDDFINKKYKVNVIIKNCKRLNGRKLFNDLIENLLSTFKTIYNVLECSSLDNGDRLIKLANFNET